MLIQKLEIKEEINQFGDIERELSDINTKYSDLVERRVKSYRSKIITEYIHSGS